MEAIRYLKRVGFDEVHRRELALTTMALEGLKQIPHVHVLGSERPEEHCGILTFTIDGVHHDVSAILMQMASLEPRRASLCPAAAGIFKGHLPPEPAFIFIIPERK